MKKMNCLALVLVGLSIGLGPAARAETSGSRSYAATVGEKFGIGVSNAATGWVELPKTMYVSSVQDGPASGLTLGFFKGIANLAGRSLLGVTDIVTFMIPTKPMISPPVIWENFDQETSYGSTWELYDTH
jgi:putative exosortase-associated protein (TIGR04073 family)